MFAVGVTSERSGEDNHESTGSVVGESGAHADEASFGDSRPGIGVLAMRIGVIHAAAAFVAEKRLPNSET